VTNCSYEELLTVWTGKPHRATRELDLLGFGDPGVGNVRAALTVGLIREDASKSSPA